MAVEVAAIVGVQLFGSSGSYDVSSDSGIELSQSSPEQSSPNDHTVEKLCSSRPCITPNVNSRLIFGTRNESVRNFGSSVTADLKKDCDSTEKLSWVISKLVRRPWTESTEFRELWSDIPSKSANHNPIDGQEQKISENDGTSASNVMADSNIDSSISLVSCKYPWTASTEFVELWSDIPSEFDAIHNREQLQEQNAISSSYVTVPCNDVSNGEQYLPTTSAIYRNSWTDSRNMTEMSNVSPHDWIYSTDTEQDTVAFCRLFSKCFVILLVMKILLSLIPISAIYMGAVHIGTCPANEGTTALVYITGISGLFLTGCHTAHHILCHFVRGWEITMNLAVNICQLITAILLIIEMILFYTMSPSFHNSENYCDEAFYNYTFYMNIVAAGIIFLSVSLQYAFYKTPSGS